MKNRSLTSYIQDDEEAEAREQIKNLLGFEPQKPASKKLAVKIYVRPEEITTLKTEDGRTISLYLPLVVTAHDKFRNCAALVIEMASDCYTGEEYRESGPHCKVGDWVLIPRNVGTQINYRGFPVQIIPEDCLYGVIEDPTYVENIIN